MRFGISKKPIMETMGVPQTNTKVRIRSAYFAPVSQRKKKAGKVKCIKKLIF